MSFRVILLPRAEADVDGILYYLRQRSPQGAESWLRRLHEVLDDLRERPLSHGLAPESAQYDVDIRQVMFKTRKGRVYRAIFTVREENVYLLHVRGPGQDIVPPNEMRLPQYAGRPPMQFPWPARTIDHSTVAACGQWQVTERIPSATAASPAPRGGFARRA